MEQRTDYIAQTTPQSPRRVMLPGKRAMYRVRDGAKRAKMFRGQRNEYVAGSEYTAAMGKNSRMYTIPTGVEYNAQGGYIVLSETTAFTKNQFQMLMAFSLVDAAEEVMRLREQLNAAEALIEELDHGKAIG